MTHDASDEKCQPRKPEPVLDTVARAIANAPVDDEPEPEEECKAVADSKAWFHQHRGQGIAHEEVLADFGLTPDDVKP